MAQAGTAAPRVGPQEEPVSAGARRFVLKMAFAGLVASGATPARASAQDRLTRDQVLAALAQATRQAPADFTGKDLSGLDLGGVDFKRANLTKCRLVRTNLAKAQLFSVTLTDAVATEADLAGANLDVAVAYRVDLRHANLRDASLFATIMDDANLADADLTHARVISPMSRAKLTRARLVNANLGADPGNQSMGVMRTDATSVDLRPIRSPKCPNTAAPTGRAMKARPKLA